MAIEVTDDRAPTDDRKQEKKITTKLMIKNGETVVIGGIFKETKTEAVDRIPWLGKVPILGWLFKAERKTSERTELLIFLTPRVVNTGGKEV
jgi:type IV pilus assembly protein PilQ